MCVCQGVLLLGPLVLTPPPSSCVLPTSLCDILCLSSGIEEEFLAARRRRQLTGHAGLGPWGADEEGGEEPDADINIEQYSGRASAWLANPPVAAKVGRARGGGAAAEGICRMEMGVCVCRRGEGKERLLVSSCCHVYHMGALSQRSQCHGGGRHTLLAAAAPTCCAQASFTKAIHTSATALTTHCLASSASSPRPPWPAPPPPPPPYHQVRRLFAKFLRSYQDAKGERVYLQRIEALVAGGWVGRRAGMEEGDGAVAAAPAAAEATGAAAAGTAAAAAAAAGTAVHAGVDGRVVSSCSSISSSWAHVNALLCSVASCVCLLHPATRPLTPLPLCRPPPAGPTFHLLEPAQASCCVTLV
jgi:hypothetical protein